MTSTIVTKPGSVHVEKTTLPLSRGQGSPRVQTHLATGTFICEFESVKNLLSGKPLRRPSRLHPIPTVTNAALRKAAAKNQPPAEWFEGEDERPF